MHHLSKSFGLPPNARRTMAATAAVILALPALLMGCPPPGAGGTPPFDTTGGYSGTYSTGDGKQFGGADNCTMELALFQLVDIPAIAYTFAGLAQLDWDCILPPLARAALGIDSEMLTLPVFARLNDNGEFSLKVDLDGNNIPPALQMLIDDSEVETDIPLQSFSLTFAGTGVDSNSDGFMDSCMGTVDLSFTYEDDGTQTVDLGGTFDVMRTGS